MALVRNNLSLKMKGRAGAYTFYSSKGRQVARVSQNSSNYGDSARRSLAQQTRRVKWANLVNFWKLTSGVLKGSFETKRANETDYNAFMRKNLSNASVALTKDMAARGCCAAEAFTISEGSLPMVNVIWGDRDYINNVQTDIKLDYAADETFTKVKELSTAIIAADRRFKNGTQLTLVTTELRDTPDGPITDFTAYEVTLDTEDNRNLSDIFGQYDLECSSVRRLNFIDVDGVIGVAVIISDSTSGSLKTSPASLVCKESSVATKYSSDAAIAAAVESYGLDPERFLDSGDYQG